MTFDKLGINVILILVFSNVTPAVLTARVFTIYIFVCDMKNVKKRPTFKVSSNSARRSLNSAVQPILKANTKIDFLSTCHFRKHTPIKFYINHTIDGNHFPLPRAIKLVI